MAGTALEGGLEVRGVSKRFSDTPAVVDVDLQVPGGGQWALLGPSGCGKTTLLRIIAGLDAPDAGVVIIGGVTVTGAGRAVPPERRRVGMVFHDWALFPHLTVAGNVAYGLSRQQVAAGRIAETLDMMSMTPLAQRRPHELSAGQAQRVALARALAPQPRVLLFDEPFSSLDAELRVSVRREVAALMREVRMTAVYVTHDQEEAFVLGDEVAVMNAGRIVQRGTPTQIYDAPATPWVAGFVGEANLVDGTAAGAEVATQIGVLRLRGSRSGSCAVLVRPEHVALDTGDQAEVRAVEFYGHDTSYQVRMGSLDLRVRAAAAPRFRVGDRVAVSYRGPDVISYEST